MAIRKKSSGVAAEDAFIRQAVAAPQAGKRVGVMVRFDPDLLRKVDAAAKERGTSRAAWIQFVVSHALEKRDI
jgi:hypothetical protein